MKEKEERRASTLQWLNVVAGAVHWVSFVVSLVLTVIYRDQIFQSALSTDWRVYDSAAPGPMQAGPYAPQLRVLGYYGLSWVELPFAAITGGYHFFLALWPERTTHYRRYVFRKQRNPYRWQEYSITASLMTWVVLAVSGVTNVMTLVVVGVVCNVVLQIFGHMMEIYNPPERKSISWWPTYSGWLLFMGQWIVIFAYFFAGVTSPRPLGVASVPWFVYTIVIGLFFQFSLFGAVQLAHFYGWPRFMRDYYYVEVAYGVLSLVSKLWLNWTLLAGTIQNPIAN